MTPGPGIEPGPHWWKVSALTTAPYLLPFILNQINLNRKYINKASMLTHPTLGKHGSWWVSSVFQDLYRHNRMLSMTKGSQDFIEIDGCLDRAELYCEK